MKIAGLDIGTTGCKITVFDGGEKLDRAYKEYPVIYQTGQHEIDASAVLDSVFAVIREVSERHGDIEAVGVTSFGETFVLTDGEGRPLHTAMLYTDSRGSEQCRELTKKLGAMHLAETAGVKPHEMYSIPKIMWMKEQRPELYQKAKHIFLMEDLIVFALTGRAQIDYSLAARTMGFDIHKLRWSQEIFEAAGIDMGLMSSPVPTGTCAGTLTKAAAEKTGLPERTRVVSISHDQIAAAVGAGVFSSEIAVDGAGTVECITPIYDEIPDMEVMAGGNYAVVPYVIPGKYVCYAFSYTGGALIQWCVDTIAKKEKEQAAEQGISVHELLEKNSQSPTGLLVLPHFAGAATPYMDGGSRGAILGLTAETRTADIYRGCMEGVVYEMMLNLEYLKDSGIHFHMLHATGGGARSAEWMQMKADILGTAVTALDVADAGTVGSAMLTGTAVGCFRNLEEAAACMVHKRKVYEPRKEMHEKYMEIFQRYKQVYGAVRPLMGD